MAPPPPPPPPPPQPPLTGIVIISLPPPDDPSKGKTITAFTFPNSDAPPPTLPPQPLRPRPFIRTRRFGLSPRQALIAIFGAALILFSIGALVFSEEPLRMIRGVRDEEGRKREDERSFLLPLYPKNGPRRLREGGDVKLALTRRQREVNSSVLMPLSGSLFPDGQYYTTIFVGNSPRPYFLDVDTGSDLTWIQCDAPCSSCAKGPHPLYKPTAGNIVPSADPLCFEVQRNQNYHFCESCNQCDYDIEYADHSSSLGVLARDSMHFMASNGDQMKLGLVFGCAYDQQGQLFVSPAKTDGILGLSNSKVSMPSQLERQGIISNVIGHCIKRETGGVGYMFLGDDYVPRWGMTWVPGQADYTNFYRTEVSRINYGGQQLGQVNQRAAIPLVFDTGSSYTYFPDEVYRNLIVSLKYATDGLIRDESDPTLPICWQANFPVRSFEDVKQLFEPLTLHFGKSWWVMSRSFSIPVEGYLVISNKGNICLGVLNGTEVHDGSTIILGDISLRGKLVVYDNVLQRIGWIQSACTKPQETRGFPFFL